MTVSDAIDNVCRDFHVAQSDVHLFIHDSPPYMVAAAEQFKSVKGYSNCVHLPCGPLLFAKVPEVAFDSGCLAEVKEFHRLVQLLFARSPYWRMKWCKFQNAAMEQWNKVHEQLTGDAKERHEREKPMPVKQRVKIFWGPLVLAQNTPPSSVGPGGPCGPDPLNARRLMRKARADAGRALVNRPTMQGGRATGRRTAPCVALGWRGKSLGLRAGRSQSRDRAAANGGQHHRRGVRGMCCGPEHRADTIGIRHPKPRKSEATL